MTIATFAVLRAALAVTIARVASGWRAVIERGAPTKRPPGHGPEENALTKIMDGRAARRALELARELPAGAELLIRNPSGAPVHLTVGRAGLAPAPFMVGDNWAERPRDPMPLASAMPPPPPGYYWGVLAAREAYSGGAPSAPIGAEIPPESTASLPGPAPGTAQRIDGGGPPFDQDERAPAMPEGWPGTPAQWEFICRHEQRAREAARQALIQSRLPAEHRSTRAPERKPHMDFKLRIPGKPGDWKVGTDE